MKRKFLNSKGLSLVEVIMSAMIMSLLLAGLYAVYVNANNMVHLASHRIVALTWAQSRLEQLRADFRGAFNDPAIPNVLTVPEMGTYNRLGNLAVANPALPGQVGGGINRYVATVTWIE